MYASVIFNRGTTPVNTSITVRDFGVRDLMGVFDIHDVFQNKDTYAVFLDDVFYTFLNPDSVSVLLFYPSR